GCECLKVAEGQTGLAFALDEDLRRQVIERLWYNAARMPDREKRLAALRRAENLATGIVPVRWAGRARSKQPAAMTPEPWEYPTRCIHCESIGRNPAKVKYPDLLCEFCRNDPLALKLQRRLRRQLEGKGSSVRAVSGGLPSLGKRR